MKIFLDTNVLIAASVRQHPHFERSHALLRRCKNKTDVGVIHSHSLLEFHSAITQLPGGLAVPPAYVAPLLNEGLLPFLRIVSLDTKAVREVQKRASERGVVGGAISDLYHLVAAEKEHVERLYTFNTSHFRAFAGPQFAARIVSP